MIFLPVPLSRLPVGSSAKIIFGLLTMARAIQTRCFCPPDRSIALFLALFLSSTTSRACIAIFLRLKRLALAILRGRRTFSSTVLLLFMKNCWKTKPKYLFLRWFSFLPFSFEALIPKIFTSPDVGLSSNAMRCIRVDLPEPDFPMIATDSPK